MGDLGINIYNAGNKRVDQYGNVFYNTWNNTVDNVYFGVESSDSYGEQSNEELEKINYIIENAFNEQQVVSLLDQNNDNSLNDTEKLNFKNFIKINCTNPKNPSIEEVEAAVIALKKGDIKYNPNKDYSSVFLEIITTGSISKNTIGNSYTKYYLKNIAKSYYAQGIMARNEITNNASGMDIVAQINKGNIHIPSASTENTQEDSYADEHAGQAPGSIEENSTYTAPVESSEEGGDNSFVPAEGEEAEYQAPESFTAAANKALDEIAKNFTEEVNKVQEQINNSTTTLDTDIDKAEKELESIKELAEKLSASLNTVKEQKEKVDDAATKEQKNYDSAQEFLNQKNALVKSIEAEISAKEQEINDYEPILAELEENAAKYDKSDNSSEAVQARLALEEGVKKHNILVEALQDASFRHGNAQKDVINAQKLLDNAQKSLDDAKEKATAAATTLTNAQASLETINNNIAALETKIKAAKEAKEKEEAEKAAEEENSESLLAQIKQAQTSADNNNFAFTDCFSRVQQILGNAISLASNTTEGESTSRIDSLINNAQTELNKYKSFIGNLETQLQNILNLVNNFQCSENATQKTKDNINQAKQIATSISNILNNLKNYQQIQTEIDKAKNTYKDYMKPKPAEE